jgi:hypothetical protein
MKNTIKNYIHANRMSFGLLGLLALIAIIAPEHASHASMALFGLTATVEIDEANTVSQTITHNITDTDMGNQDSVTVDPVAFPITPGNNTYEKWQKVHVTAMGGSSKIDNLKVWRTGALGGAAVHLTNARTSSYGGAPTFATPIATSSSIATQTMPTSVPGSANLGIGGSLSGSLTTTGSSDYLVHQIQTNASDTAGSTSTMNYQYDETA